MHGKTPEKIATNTVIKTIHVSSQRMGVAFDSHKNEIFVVNHGWGTVSVISDATNTVIETITVGKYIGPVGVVFDQAENEIFVTDYYSAEPGRVSVFAV